jgi:Na+-driven multidrug efflux pump
MNRNPTMSLLSLGFGIGALPLLFCFFLGIPSGVLAIGFGIAALRRGRTDAAEHRWRWAALLGLVLGVLGVALGIFFIAHPDD